MCSSIVECGEGELNLKYEHSYVEILNEYNFPCKTGERGRLIFTGFGNLAFPLIRYDIKNIVTISKTDRAKCGKVD